MAAVVIGASAPFDKVPSLEKIKKNKDQLESSLVSVSEPVAIPSSNPNLADLAKLS